MAVIKVTQKGIEALVAKPQKARQDYFDQAHPGLCLTVGARGAVWWYFRRIDGTLNRIRLGAWPQTGIKAARDAAAMQESAIAEGKHPKTEQARQRAELALARGIDQERLFENAAEAWAAQHLPGVAEQTRRMYRRALDRLIDAFGGRDIGTVTRGELIRLLDRVKAATPSGIPANHTAATMRLLFSWAHDRLEIGTNPAHGIKNPATVKARSVVLTRDELRIVWRACEDAGYPYGHALRFQLATGQRIGEVGDIRRNEVEGDFWMLSRNKTGNRIDVFLNTRARAILTDCPNYGPDAPFFSATGEGGVRPDGFHNAINRHIRPRLNEAADALGLPRMRKHWTPHDLRRTVRSGLTGWAGVFPEIAERTINHAIGGIRKHYDHADYRPHIAGALTQWDAELSRILSGKGATVTPIKSRSTKRRSA